MCTCGVVGDGMHMWCGGRWRARVVWWEMVCTCGVVGDGVHVWCGGRWCAHVVWWEMVCTCGVVGDDVHVWCVGLSQLCSIFDQLCYSFMLHLLLIMLQKCTNCAPLCSNKMGVVAYEL